MSEPDSMPVRESPAAAAPEAPEALEVKEAEAPETPPAAPEASPPASAEAPAKLEARPEARPRPENRGGGRPGGEPRPPRPPQEARGPKPPGERRGDERRAEGPRGDDRRGDRGPRDDRGGRDRERGRFEGPQDIDLDKLIADSLYLDNQAHAVVARMRDMESGTRSQLRRLYSAVRRACRAPESERQHQFVMLRARLAYTIARHSLRSLDTLERLLLQVTRKNDARGYERFRDLFEAIVAYNE